jgi:hypothetical protein
MSDEAKLGLVAGVLAVIGVAVFGQPAAPPKSPPKTASVVGTPSPPPTLPPVAVVPGP